MTDLGLVTLIGDSLTADSAMTPDAKTFISSRLLSQGFSKVWHYGYWGKTINTARTTGGVNDPATVDQVAQALTEGTPSAMVFALGTNSVTSWEQFAAWRDWTGGAASRPPHPDIVPAREVLDKVPATVMAPAPARQWVHDGTALRPARQIGA